MINLEKKIEELTEKYGEPGKGAEGRYLHESIGSGNGQPGPGRTWTGKSEYRYGCARR